MSSGTPTPADVFEDLWRQLRECHQNALQELDAKVSKLKKERCLDAQKLELFYTRNQQLKEQNNTLEDTISLMENRLRTGECDFCAIFKKDHDQNLRLITVLKKERNSLADENKKLRTELQNVETSRSELKQTSSPEQEEGIIPDSPVLPSSLPVANKLKKRRDIHKVKHVRYAEVPLPQSNNPLFNEPATNNPGGAEVLVPDTCDLDTSQISNDANLKPDEVIAETCRLEPLDWRMETAAGQKSSKSPRKHGFCLKPHRSSRLFTLTHSPDSTTETSPSLLPRFKRFSENRSVYKAKRKMEESEPEEREEDKQDKQREGKQPELIKQTSTPANSPTFKKEQRESKVQSEQHETLNQRPSVSFTSAAFKKPNVRWELKEDSGKKRGKALQELNATRDQHEEDAERKHHEEPAWSVDSALALSMNESEWSEDKQKEKQQCHGDLVDTDCTWVSHSLLQGRRQNCPDRGLGKRANDSLDMMFDTTACGEYESCNSSHSGQSQPCDEENEEDDEDDEKDPPENDTSLHTEHKAQRPTFAHVAVIRKKDERRKLKGTTCKECDIYYANLPEGEKQKKLSVCSRHRFLYIPPSTPENFWDVGFPSTQTCIERGYIREETNPQTRSRRRQPFNALFSPKPNQQES